MANVTDPLICAVQGSDPQNLMEYITRQKIYDSRFWKEECFGMTAADVLERAAKSLKCIGGTFGANQQPTKFLCLTLKLLQLQPDGDLVQEFIDQDHFKYVKALGAFYLRLTGRPPDIYESLEPLYAAFEKLKYRSTNEWKLLHMDEFVHELVTQPFACGIALPRLPFRETLQQEGYLGEGPRPTALREVLEEAGGLEEYLQYKAKMEKSAGAIAMLEKRLGKDKTTTTKDKIESKQDDDNNDNNDALTIRRKETRPPQQQQQQQEALEEGEEKEKEGEAAPIIIALSSQKQTTANENRRRRRLVDERKTGKSLNMEPCSRRNSERTRRRPRPQESKSPSNRKQPKKVQNSIGTRSEPSWD